MLKMARIPYDENTYGEGVWMGWEPGILGVFASGLLLALWGALFWRKRTEPDTQPALLFSTLQAFGSGGRSWRVVYASLPRWLERLAIALFLIALLNPYVLAPSPGRVSPKPLERAGFYLLVDHSGSMAEEVQTPLGKLSKINFLKKWTTQFIQGVPEDLLGLVAFARTARVLVPLTWDHKAVVDALQKIEVVKDREQEGTAMGYAILKTAHVIAATRYYGEETLGKRAPEYSLKNVAIVLVTDGFPDPNPADVDNPLRMTSLEQAAQYAKEQNVRLYVIIIDPALANASVAPQRRLLQRVTEQTGGKFYLIDATMNLQDIFEEVRTVEKGFLPPQGSAPPYQPIHVHYGLILAGLGLLSLASVLRGTVWRSIP